MKIYIANYIHSLDAECIIDDCRERDEMMMHLITCAAIVPVVSRDRDDALARIIALLAREILDTNDECDRDACVPEPTIENVVLMTDHEYSTPTSFVYAYDVEPLDFFVRIVITELTID